MLISIKEWKEYIKNDTVSILNETVSILNEKNFW